jgi:hypothetical protein
VPVNLHARLRTFGIIQLHSGLSNCSNRHDVPIGDFEVAEKQDLLLGPFCIVVYLSFSFIVCRQGS